MKAFSAGGLSSEVPYLSPAFLLPNCCSLPSSPAAVEVERKKPF